MAAPSPLALPGLLLALAGGLAWLTLGDRSSALALHALELEGTLGLPLWTVVGGPGLLLLGWRLVRAGGAPAPAARSHPRGPEPAPATKLPADLAGAAAALALPPGARLLVEPRGTAPLRLVLEQCTEHRARRALEAVAGLLARGPRPPRLRIDIHDCPPPTTPWHHIVAAALATALPRGETKVLRQAHGVDVMLLRPDPSWTAT